MSVRARNWLIACAASLIVSATSAQTGPIETVHVQGNVYLLAGSTANVAVQIGDDGVIVVDPGGAATSDAVLAAIRELSDGPIRWIINTHEHADHTGANAVISAAGVTVNGNPAAIVAHENVLGRMHARISFLFHSIFPFYYILENLVLCSR